MRVREEGVEISEDENRRYGKRILERLKFAFLGNRIHENREIVTTKITNSKIRSGEESKKT
jgi:hypothetical protein